MKEEVFILFHRKDDSVFCHFQSRLRSADEGEIVGGVTRRKTESHGYVIDTVFLKQSAYH